MKSLIFEKWDKEKYDLFKETIKLSADEKYREFHSSLVPDSSKIYGVRIPVLRNIAKEISKGNGISFLEFSKTDSYEERIIQGFVISNLKLDYDKMLLYTDSFADKIDSWAVCDCVCASFKFIKKHKKEYFLHIQKFLNSKNPWHIRYGLVVLLDYYVDNEYIDEIFNIMDNIKNREYYVMMALAWLLSVCYAKFPKETYLYMKKSKIYDEAFNKGIQKIRESSRVSKEDKEKILNLKRI